MDGNKFCGNSGNFHRQDPEYFSDHRLIHIHKWYQGKGDS